MFGRTGAPQKGDPKARECRTACSATFSAWWWWYRDLRTETRILFSFSSLIIYTISQKHIRPRPVNYSYPQHLRRASALCHISATSDCVS